MLSCERRERAVGAQFAQSMRGAKAIERGGGFHRAWDGERAAGGEREGKERDCEKEKFHRHSLSPRNAAAYRRRIRCRTSLALFVMPGLVPGIHAFLR